MNAIIIILDNDSMHVESYIHWNNPIACYFKYNLNLKYIFFYIRTQTTKQSIKYTLDIFDRNSMYPCR